MFNCKSLKSVDKSYLVTWTEIFCDGLPLLGVHHDAVVAVVADVPDQAGLLGQRQQPALHGGDLQQKFT